MTDKQELKCPWCGSGIHWAGTDTGGNHYCDGALRVDEFYCSYQGPDDLGKEKSTRFHQIQQLKDEIAEAAAEIIHASRTTAFNYPELARLIDKLEELKDAPASGSTGRDETAKA